MSQELWDIQKKFNDKFFMTKGGWPGADQLVTANKDFAIHLIAEASEVLKEISFKMHRTSTGPVDRDNVLEELIDVQKFLYGWMQIWGFTWDDIVREFLRKSMVVNQRFDQEQSLPVLRDKPCVLVDIDGILAEYPGYYRRWADEHDLLWDSADPLVREAVKREYRMSGAKASVPVLPGSREMLEAIRGAGVKIILITMRPYAEHYRIYPDTLEWLAKNDLPYDAILWAREKGLEALKNFSRILFAVDDDAKNIEMYEKAGIRAVGIGPKYGTTTAEFAQRELSMMLEVHK